MSLANLRKFSTTVIKDKSATDAAQIPATVDIDVYKRGATVSAVAIISAGGGTGAVSVFDIGSLEVSSTVKVGTDVSSNLTVTAIASATSITVRNDHPSIDVALTFGSRLVMTSSRPSLWRDTTGSSIISNAGHTTTDARGYVEFYVEEEFFDYIATTGSQSALYSDQGGGATTPAWINVTNYLTFQDAIDAAVKYGSEACVTVYVPPGKYNENTVPAVGPMTITSNSITLRGDGIASTWIQYTASASNTLITITSSDFTRIEGIRFEGIGSSGAGRCISIKSSSNVHLEDLWIDNWPSWGIDTSDSVGDCVSLRVDKVRITRNKSNGCLKLSDRAFGPIFRCCAFVPDAGRSVHLNQTSKPVFMDCTFENTADGASADGSTNACFYSDAAFQVTLRGAWFESAVSNVTPNNWFIFFTDGGIDRGHYLEDIRFVRSGAAPTSLRAIKSLGSGLSRSTLIGIKGQLNNVSVGTDDMVFGAGDSVSLIGRMTVIDSAFTTFKEMSVTAGNPLTIQRFNNNRRNHIEIFTTAIRDALTEQTRGDYVGNSNNDLLQYYTQDATGSKWLSLGVWFGTTAARNALTWTRGDLTWITDGAGPRLEINTVAGTPGTFAAV